MTRFRPFPNHHNQSMALPSLHLGETLRPITTAIHNNQCPHPPWWSRLKIRLNFKAWGQFEIKTPQHFQWHQNKHLQRITFPSKTPFARMSRQEMSFVPIHAHTMASYYQRMGIGKLCNLHQQGVSFLDWFETSCVDRLKLLQSVFSSFWVNSPPFGLTYPLLLFDSKKTYPHVALNSVEFQHLVKLPYHLTHSSNPPSCSTYPLFTSSHNNTSNHLSETKVSFVYPWYDKTGKNTTHSLWYWWFPVAHKRTLQPLNNVIPPTTLLFLIN